MPNKLFIAILLCLGMTRAPGLLGQSNIGTDFWMSFLEHFDEGTENKVLMITGRFNTQGTVEIPLDGWQKSFEVKANEVTFVELPANAAAKGSERISPSGVHIQTKDPVAVYAHQYQTFRSEAAVILPTPSLGRRYFVMTYTGYDRDDGIYPSEFTVVATRDGTTITIDPSDFTVGLLYPGRKQTLTLDAGESYQVQAANGNTGDLTGSQVTGDKPFAVFAGNKWTQIPNGCNARDNLFEQMSPVSTWGRQFIAASNSSALFDIFRVLAAEDNTQVQVQGASTQTYTLNAGEFQEFQWNGPAIITANRPIMVGQFNVGRDCNGLGIGDPSMVVLNSIEQTRDTITLYSSAFQNITANFINMVVRTEDLPTVQLDDRTLASWNAEVNTLQIRPEYSIVTVQVPSGTHNLISQGCGLIATAYGYGDAESYAYAAGANLRPLNDIPLPEGGCLAEEIEFDTGIREDTYAFLWDFGDGTSSTEARPSHAYQQVGTFDLRVTITHTCSNTTHTFDQEMLISRKVLPGNGTDTTVCAGEVIELTATPVPLATFRWEGPNGFTSTAQDTLLFNAQPGDAGLYQAYAIVVGCSSNVAETQVRVLPPPRPSLGRDTTLCPGDELILQAGRFTRYLWQDGSQDSLFQVTLPGIYGVRVTDGDGCEGRDSVSILEKCPDALFAPNAFTPNGDGINDEFRLVNLALSRVSYRIYDRWGRLVFESPEVTLTWNGQLPNGNPAPQGVYVWVAEVTGTTNRGNPYEQTLTGSLTLIR